MEVWVSWWFLGGDGVSGSMFIAFMVNTVNMVVRQVVGAEEGGLGKREGKEVRDSVCVREREQEKRKK